MTEEYRPPIPYKLRHQVYQRDGGVCQVCHSWVRWALYECGHKIDWCISQNDELENLITLCFHCNRYAPVCATIEEFEAYAATGGKLKIFTEGITHFQEQYPKAWEAMYPSLNESQKQSLAIVLLKNAFDNDAMTNK